MTKSQRSTLIAAILACLLAAYIVVVVPLTIRAERNDTFSGLDINVVDSAGTGFLTEADINAAMGNLSGQLDTLRRRNLDTYRLEQILNGHQRVEKASCYILNNGVLRVTVEPFDPVARVFDSQGSFYVNTEGKRVVTKPEYHVDVPVITMRGTADSLTIRHLLPVLRVLKTNPRANALVSSLSIDRRGDIIIIPNVTGHVINFGDNSQIDNKLERLKVFYRDVMPYKGWNAYDTISVKWSGRIVATKRDKSLHRDIKSDQLDYISNDIPQEEENLLPDIHR